MLAEMDNHFNFCLQRKARLFSFTFVMLQQQSLVQSTGDVEMVANLYL